MYIKIYNTLTTLISLYTLYLSIKYFLSPETATLRYITLCQTYFLLEIVNILVGSSKSSIFPTTIQLSSRLLISWLLYLNNTLNKIYGVMFISWYVADLIRYLYYTSKFNIFKKLRYNLFIILYPLGTFIEIYFLNSLDVMVGGFYSKILEFLMICYLPGFVFLFYHMIRRRKSIISRDKRVKKIKKID